MRSISTKVCDARSEGGNRPETREISISEKKKYIYMNMYIAIIIYI